MICHGFKGGIGTSSRLLSLEDGGYTLSLVLLQGVSFDMINVLEGNPGGPTPMSPGGSNGIAMNSRITADGRDGFLHPFTVEGGVAEVKIRVLLRDFASDELTRKAA